MLPVYYGCMTPTVKAMQDDGLLVVAPHYAQGFGWSPRYYCKACGIGYPSFSRV